MYYVYLLKSGLTNKWYIGYTNDLRRRLKEHNSSKNIATKSGVPWKLMYYEAYPTEQSALIREQKLKYHGKGLSELKRRIMIG